MKLLAKTAIKRHRRLMRQFWNGELRTAALHGVAAFSLIEVMVAILILGVGLVGLTQGITGALNSSKDAERLTIAAQIAAGQLETLRAEGFIVEGDTEGDGGEGLTGYEWKQSITKSTVDGLYEVSVAVRHSATGREIYDLRTLMFDPPVTTDAQTNSTRQGRPEGRSVR